MSLAKPPADLVDAAPFKTAARDYRLAPRAKIAGPQSDAFQRRSVMRQHMRGPGNLDAHIRRRERRKRHTFGREDLRPATVRAKPSPTRPAERQHRHIRFDDLVPG